ncbi:MAG TPA: putative metal-dependent hydrolase [Symbiobacteriaceae bacterium]|nr:putative metal-dependent hydrolase [Symbiobacteriaceae bacterium]
MTDLRYPVGRFTFEGEVSEAHRKAWIDEVAAAPARLRAAVAGLTAAQLDTPYREGGWTVRQVVHHLADSDMNAYIRFKLALTETEPTVKPTDEGRWAELPDARSARVEISLELLEAVHERWVITLRAMSAVDFERAYMHPQNGRTTLDKALALYAWHGRHHTAHITAVRNRMDW